MTDRIMQKTSDRGEQLAGYLVSATALRLKRNLKPGADLDDVLGVLDDLFRAGYELGRDDSP